MRLQFYNLAEKFPSKFRKFHVEKPKKIVVSILQKSELFLEKNPLDTKNHVKIFFSFQKMVKQKIFAQKDTLYKDVSVDTQKTIAAIVPNVPNNF